MGCGRAHHEDGSLVEEIGQVSAGHANGQLSCAVQQRVALPHGIAAARNGLVLGMDLHKETTGSVLPGCIVLQQGPPFTYPLSAVEV